MLLADPRCPALVLFFLFGSSLISIISLNQFHGSKDHVLATDSRSILGRFSWIQYSHANNATQ